MCSFSESYFQGQLINLISELQFEIAALLMVREYSPSCTEDNIGITLWKPWQPSCASVAKSFRKFREKVKKGICINSVYSSPSLSQKMNINNSTIEEKHMCNNTILFSSLSIIIFFWTLTFIYPLVVTMPTKDKDLSCYIEREAGENLLVFCLLVCLCQLDTMYNHLRRRNF